MIEKGVDLAPEAFIPHWFNVFVQFVSFSCVYLCCTVSFKNFAVLYICSTEMLINLNPGFGSEMWFLNT